MKSIVGFVRQVVSDWREVGAILPSFPVVGSEMAKWIQRDPEKPLRVLELGAGDGAVTDRIIRCLRPGDELVLVEISPQFCRFLQKRIEGRWSRWLKGVNVTIHEGPLQTMDDSEPFDVVVSGLPVLNFPLEDVRNVLTTYPRLVSEGGALLSLEYALSLQARLYASRLFFKRELRESCQQMREFIARNQAENRVLLSNFPPMVIRKFEFVGAEGMEDAAKDTSDACAVSDIAESC